MKITRICGPTAVPVHVDGWSHFSQQEQAAAVFGDAPESVRGRIRWLPLDEAAQVTASI
jgi:hypothetical protein